MHRGSLHVWRTQASQPLPWTSITRRATDTWRPSTGMTGRSLPPVPPRQMWQPLGATTVFWATRFSTASRMSSGSSMMPVDLGSRFSNGR